MNFRIPRDIDRGSLSVEAAIMLPIFLIAMLALAIMIRMVSVSENVTHAMTDELALVASEGNVPNHTFTFVGSLEKRVEEENENDINEAEVLPYKYRVPNNSVMSGKTYDNIVGATVTTDVNLGFANMFGIDANISSTAICRAFTGTLAETNQMPFSELEDNGDGGMVWVFPRAGEKYHIDSCSVIKNNPKEVLLTQEVRAAYTPCELCKPNEAPNGTLVYLFSTAGKAYHRGDCFIVDRFVISIDRNDAKEKGYTACAKCGGGE
jgi:hypothetical protein